MCRDVTDKLELYCDRYSGIPGNIVITRLKSFSLYCWMRFKPASSLAANHEAAARIGIKHQRRLKSS